MIKYLHAGIALFLLILTFGMLAPNLISADSDAAVILGMLVVFITPPILYLYVTKTIFTKTEKKES